MPEISTGQTTPIQPITSPRAREESMPDLGEFAALFVVLFLTMYW